MNNPRSMSQLADEVRLGLTGPGPGLPRKEIAVSEKTLIMTVGLPRSGKSTWAKKQGHPIVNPDAVRLAFHGSAFVPSAEKMVWTICHYMAKSLFLAGHDKVILDACNNTRASRDNWRGSWNVEFQTFTATAKECADRVTHANPNGNELLATILRMDTQHEPVTPEEVNP